MFGLGLAIIVLSSFLIDHGAFVGLRQVYAYSRGRDPSPVPFQAPRLYRYVRHPLMTGMFLWIWVTPTMTVGHLLLAAGLSIYIIVGVRLEERMLMDAFGEAYSEYRRRVPMFIPRPWRSFDPASDVSDATSD